MRLLLWLLGGRGQDKDTAETVGQSRYGDEEAGIMSRIFRILSVTWLGFWTFIFYGGCAETVATSAESEHGLIIGMALVIWMLVAVMPAAICWGAGRRIGDARRRTV